MPRRKTRNPKSTSQGDVSEAVQSSAEKPEGSDAQSSASQTTVATITGLNEKQWKSTIGSLPSAMRDVKGALYRARTAASNATEANNLVLGKPRTRVRVRYLNPRSGFGFDARVRFSKVRVRVRGSRSRVRTFEPRVRKSGHR